MTLILKRNEGNEINMKLASKEAIDLQEDYEGKKAEALISYG